MADIWSAITSFFTTYQIPFRIILILIVAIIANFALRLALKRAVGGIVSGVKRHQDVDATQELSIAPHVTARAVQRTRTLGTVGRHFISWVVVIITMILVLSQLGVNLGAVLTSAGFVAAGLAFGAQNIVKDILNGIFMVFEDQLGVGDWITVGTISGTVEDVGIRITKVRANDGTLWFIRNGEILTLGNASQGWGQAIVDISVLANQDLDLVERGILESANELLHSPQFARRVTGEPDLLGLQSLSGDRATMRLTVRTRPEAQWSVERELRSRINKRFGDLGIEMAPDRTIAPEASA